MFYIVSTIPFILGYFIFRNAQNFAEFNAKHGFLAKIIGPEKVAAFFGIFFKFIAVLFVALGIINLVVFFIYHK